jgi:hypothetical protein
MKTPLHHSSGYPATGKTLQSKSPKDVEQSFGCLRRFRAKKTAFADLSRATVLGELL